MKATRLLLAALAISLFSAACSATDITAPAAPAEVQAGMLGSGAG
jgi:nitrous oxide reductase accessory protein NosL